MGRKYLRAILGVLATLVVSAAPVSATAATTESAGDHCVVQVRPIESQDPRCPTARSVVVDARVGQRVRLEYAVREARGWPEFASRTFPVLRVSCQAPLFRVVRGK